MGGSGARRRADAPAPHLAPGAEVEPFPERSGSPTPAGFSPPEPAEVETYLAAQTMHPIDAARFCDHFASVGWVDARGRPIADWRAKARQWSRDDAAREAQAASEAKGGGLGGQWAELAELGR